MVPLLNRSKKLPYEDKVIAGYIDRSAVIGYNYTLKPNVFGIRKRCVMKNYYIEKIKAARRNGTLLAGAKRVLFRFWRIYFIKNAGILELQHRDMLYRKLFRKYRSIIAAANHKTSEEAEFPKIVWWCWFQGYDQAPELVKSCHESIKRNMPGYEIRIITFENLFEYVTLPEHITEKFKRGKIGMAHFSDIIRLELLIRYGGVWVDATVLCTDADMCTVIERAPLFAYQISNGMGNNSFASSWLISAKPNSPILILTRELLFAYWRTYRTQKHYFLFHLLFSMAVYAFPEIHRRIPAYNNASPHALERELSYEYSEERFVEIKKYASFHKLNFKRAYSQQRNTFYDVLIKQRHF